jgi:tRNA G18 (ribose-2'-O)-methylase SpoU
VAEYVGLTDADLRRRIEVDGGLFIAEGELALRQLLISRYPIRSVLVTPAGHRRLVGDLESLAAPVYVASQQVMDAVAGFPIHRGVVAAAGRLPLPDVADVLTGARTVAVLEDLNDHENIGALFRNAAAFGVDGVLLSPACADPLYRRAVRVSLGHVLRVPYTVMGDWPAGIAGLAAAGWETVALTPSGGTPVGELSRVRGPVAVLLGAEGRGLSAAALAAAGRTVRIPMADGVDSLNVATAAAVAFHRLADRV